MRRTSLGLVGALSAFGGSVVGGVLVLALVRPAQPTASLPRIEPSQPRRDDQLLARVEELERAIRLLTLRQSVGPSSSPAGVASSPGLSKGSAAQDPAPLVDSPVFDAAVRDVVARVEQERNAERDAQMADIHKRQSEFWSNQLVEKLHLTEAQRVRVAEIGEKFWLRLREMVPKPNGAPAAPADFRSSLEAIRTETETELSKVLDTAQMNSYRELDGEFRLGAFNPPPRPVSPAVESKPKN